MQSVNTVTKNNMVYCLWKKAGRLLTAVDAFKKGFRATASAALGGCGLPFFPPLLLNETGLVQVLGNAAWQMEGLLALVFASLHSVRLRFNINGETFPGDILIYKPVVTWAQVSHSPKSPPDPSANGSTTYG